MATEAIANQLNGSLQILQSRWNATKAVWNDAVSTHFETAYIRIIEQQTSRTVTEMSDLERVLSEAKRRVR